VIEGTGTWSGLVYKGASRTQPSAGGISRDNPTALDDIPARPLSRLAVTHVASLITLT
jgi:hypothetical protein